MTLEPLYTIPLVYQLTDPYDTGTYYVRSVVKDSSSGTVLDSTNLTARGSGRYTGSIVAPQDSTGFGRHIDIVTSVYTNAGYTTYSDVYALKVENHVIRKTPTSFGSGSIGPDIDYKKIRKIVEEVVDLKVSAIKIPVTELKPVYEAIANVDRTIRMLDKPIKEVDLSLVTKPLASSEKAIIAKIDAIKFPDQTDHILTTIGTEIKDLKTDHTNGLGSTKDQLLELKNEIQSMLEKFVTEISTNYQMIKKFKKILADQSLVNQDIVNTKPEKPKNPEIDKYFNP